MQLCQRKTRRPTLRDWRLISASALLLIALSPFSAAIASTNASSEMGGGDPRSVRIPAIDGDDIRFSRLSTAQGLSQTQANQIVQDDQGFIWFGTQYGLDRYDGYEFKVFTHPLGDARNAGARRENQCAPGNMEPARSWDRARIEDSRTRCLQRSGERFAVANAPPTVAGGDAR